MQIFRTSGDEQVLDSWVQGFYDSGYSAQDAEALCSGLRTKFETSDELGSLMQAADISMASRMSEFVGASMDPRMDSSYMLIFAGEPSMQNRESIKMLKEFTRFAEQRNASIMGPCPGCEAVSFTAIHFDSFCSHFCQPEHCRRWCANCIKSEHALGSSSLHSSSSAAPLLQAEEWCKSPQTSLLLSTRNMQPERIAAQKIQIPTIDVLEVRARGSEVEMVLRGSSCAAFASRHLLRISWESKEVTEEGVRRAFHHQDFEIDNEADIALPAGKLYSFQLAAVNDLGTGPFSAKHQARQAERRLGSEEAAPQAPSRLFGLPVPLIVSLGPEDPSQNRAPSWRCTEVTVTLSGDAKEEIALVRFSDFDGMHPNFTCTPPSYSRSFSEIRCTIPARITSLDIFWRVEVFGMDSLVAEAGVLLEEAPSIQACRHWDRALYCDSFEPACVQTCEECAERPHANSSFPNCTSTSAYWGTLSDNPASNATNHTNGTDDAVGEVCPAEPVPYWEEASFRRLSASPRVPSTKLFLKFYLRREASPHPGSPCDTAVAPVPDTCLRQVPSPQLSPIQRLRLDSVSDSVVLAGEILFLVPDVHDFLHSNSQIRLLSCFKKCRIGF